MLREIERGEPAFDRFIAALTQADLPTDDLFDEPFRYFEWDECAWGGFGGGPDALLRSIVVAAPARGCGHGAAIINALVEAARDAGAQRLWLLTMNARAFFEPLGWRVMDRDAAPPHIASSRQFTSLCPASATLMVRAL
jgi:amino-acid N-acetyltransferase